MHSEHLKERLMTPCLPLFRYLYFALVKSLSRQFPFVFDDLNYFINQIFDFIIIQYVIVNYDENGTTIFVLSQEFEFTSRYVPWK